MPPVTSIEKAAAVTTRDGLNLILLTSPPTRRKDRDNECLYHDGAYV